MSCISGFSMCRYVYGCVIREILSCQHFYNVDDLCNLQSSSSEPQRPMYAGFFPGGDWGVPPSSKNFVNPPIQHLSPFLDQGLSPPQPRFFPENLKNLNIFCVKFDYF